MYRLENNKEGENLIFHNEEKLFDCLKKQIEEKDCYDQFVALDADGTLWPEDANNILLEYQITKGFQDLKEFLKPDYQVETHRYKRCELFVQRQKGLTLEAFQSYCLKALQKKPLHVFPFQIRFLQYLKQKGMKIIVVTASIKWLVEVAVRLYDLPVDEVLGVETQLQEGLISSQLVRPAPIAKYKGDVFLKYSQGKKCLIAGGNTSSDLPLLEMASVPFVVHSARPENENFSAEQKLKKQAINKGWILFENLL